MTEKELGKSLLNLDLGSPPGSETRQLTQAIVTRDRRWVRILAGITTFFYLLATGGVIWMVCMYFLYLDPRLRAYGAGRAHLERDVDAWVIVFEIVAWSILGCVLAVLLAAISTVVLVLWSRRATLRQINANLVLISEQLKQLQAISPSR